ncbi:DUF3025 domain-containing protein [Psychrobacter sp. DM8]|uniref:DUF3025 domain-containing protein n=1 Tax=Psychrobacter sp. DM8 TaxID=3440636 RepID=UPI003F500CA7
MSPIDLPVTVHSNNAINAKKSLFANIDWQAPWLCHLSQLTYLSQTIEQLSAAHNNSVNLDNTEHLDVVAGVLNIALIQQSDDSQIPQPTTKPALDHDRHTLNFVSQNVLPEGVGYEQFIGSTGNIPTRDNLHDLFNGSIWLTFPKTKAVLNYYHMLEISKRSDEQDSDEQDNQSNRGRVRDTITVFDENGAVLVTSNPSVGEALINFDWQGCLIAPRASWDNPKQPHADAQAAVYIFGHALLEQLITPRKPLCAHSVIINVDQNFFALSMPERIAFLDDALANYMDRLLSKEDVVPRHLSPLPILGVPHFWTDNINRDFYDDNYVFRSGRRRSK